MDAPFEFAVTDRGRNAGSNCLVYIFREAEAQIQRIDFGVFDGERYAHFSVAATTRAEPGVPLSTEHRQGNNPEALISYNLRTGTSSSAPWEYCDNTGPGQPPGGFVTYDYENLDVGQKIVVHADAHLLCRQSEWRAFTLTATTVITM